MKMKNLLSENMLRFGTKNLSESQLRALTLKGIIKTINEHGLHNEVRWHLNEAVTSFDQTTVAFTKVTPLKPGQASGEKTSFMPYSFVMKNTGGSEAIITGVSCRSKDWIGTKGFPIGSNSTMTVANGKNFVVSAKGKSFPFDSAKGGYVIPPGTAYRINTILGIWGIDNPERKKGRANPGNLMIEVYGNFPKATTETPIPPIVTNRGLGVVSQDAAKAKLGIAGI